MGGCPLPADPGDTGSVDRAPALTPRKPEVDSFARPDTEGDWTSAPNDCPSGRRLTYAMSRRIPAATRNPLGILSVCLTICNCCGSGGWGAGRGRG